MKGEITKIDEHPRPAKQGGVYYMVFFKMEDGRSAKTYLCPQHRNYPRWSGVLKVGKRLSGLTMKSDNLVDADSYPNA